MSSLFAELNSVFGTPAVESETETTVTEETTETTEVEGANPATIVEQDTVVTETPTESLPVAPEAVTNDETVETAIIDNAETEEQVENLTEGIDTAEEVVARAEALYATMESFLERGGMTDGERQIMAHALESYHDQVGLVFNPTQLGSLESFGDVNTRYDATVAALEDIGDFMRKVGAGIKEAGFRALDAVTDHLGRWFSTQDGMIKRAQAISEAAASMTVEEANKAKGQTIKGGRYARAFLFDGKVNSAIAAAKRNQEVIGEIAKNWDPQPKTLAYQKALAGMKVAMAEAQDAEGNTIAAPKELSEGVHLLEAGKTLFKDKIDPKEVSQVIKNIDRMEGVTFLRSKELPGAKYFVEVAIGGAKEGGNRSAHGRSADDTYRHANTVVLVNAKGYGEVSKEEVPVATPGDIKTICKLVEDTCNATKELYEKRKKLNSVIESLKKGFNNLVSSGKSGFKNAAIVFGNDASNFKNIAAVAVADGAKAATNGMQFTRTPKVTSVTNAVMVGFTHLDDVVRQANKQSLFISKVLLDYCDTCIKVSKGQKVLDDKNTEETTTEA
jgi:hypothetical protein